MPDFFCPYCSAKLTVDDSQAGEHANCPFCRNRFVIPAPATEVLLLVHSAPVNSTVERRRSWGTRSLCLGLIACSLSFGSIIIGVLLAREHRKAIDTRAAASQSDDGLPPEITILLVGVYAAGVAVGIAGMAAAVKGIKSSDVQHTECWIGGTLSAFPLCFAIIVILFLAASAANDRSGRRRRTW